MTAGDEMTEWKRKESCGWHGGKKIPVGAKMPNHVTANRATDYKVGSFFRNEPTVGNVL
jgi:hypothetical protein